MSDDGKGSKNKYFKPTVITPEIAKELKDPKGWVTGRLLPKRKRQKNKKFVETPKGKGKTRPKGWKKKGYDVNDPTKPSPSTPVDDATEQMLNESDEVD